MSVQLEEITTWITRLWERKPELARAIGDIARGYTRGDLDMVKKGQETIQKIKYNYAEARRRREERANAKVQKETEKRRREEEEVEETPARKKARNNTRKAVAEPIEEAVAPSSMQVLIKAEPSTPPPAAVEHEPSISAEPVSSTSTEPIPSTSSQGAYRRRNFRRNFCVLVKMEFEEQELCD